MSKILQGKKPVSERPMSVSDTHLMSNDMFGNVLALDPSLQAELDKKGLVPRWVNAKELYTNQGYHKRGWRPYKRDSGTLNAGMESFLGNDPEGIVRRGDSILAVKTKEEHARHKQVIESRAKRLKQAVSKQHAQQLREFAAESRVKTHIEEGYDDSGEDDEV